GLRALDAVAVTHPGERLDFGGGRRHALDGAEVATRAHPRARGSAIGLRFELAGENERVGHQADVEFLADLARERLPVALARLALAARQVPDRIPDRSRTQQATIAQEQERDLVDDHARTGRIQ